MPEIDTGKLRELLDNAKLPEKLSPTFAASGWFNGIAGIYEIEVTRDNFKHEDVGRWLIALHNAAPELFATIDRQRAEIEALQGQVSALVGALTLCPPDPEEFADGHGYERALTIRRNLLASLSAEAEARDERLKAEGAAEALRLAAAARVAELLGWPEASDEDLRQARFMRDWLNARADELIAQAEARKEGR